MSKATTWRWVSYNDKPERPFTSLVNEHGDAVLSSGGVDIHVEDDTAALLARAPALRDALRELLNTCAEVGEDAPADNWKRLDAAQSKARAALDGL